MATRKTSSCCGVNKMCALTCCACGIDVKKLKKIVKDAKYVCKMCGHVAKSASYLCEPVKL